MAINNIMELAFILIVLALFLLGFALLIVLYKWLLRRGYRRLALLFPALIIVVVGYGAYVSLVPRDSFYKEDFEKYSGVHFPASGRIIKKYASYPNLQGEYISVALIKLSSADYQTLKEELNQASGSVVDTAGYPFLEHTFRFLGDSTRGKSKNFAVIYRVNKSVIGLYKDGNTILFEKGIK
jgi:amino acid transporter